MPAPVSDIVAAMDAVGRDRAVNRSRGTRVVSALATKLHKWKKPRNIARAVVEGVVQLIPVPGVGSGVAWLVGHAEQKADGYARSRRAKNPQDEYRDVKFSIKDLDVSALDRARYKVVSQIDQYNKEAARAEQSNMCIRGFWLAYRYRRMEYRAERLRDLSKTLNDVAEKLDAWSKEQKRSIKAFERTHLDNLKQLLEKESKHPDGSCGNACLYDGESKGAENFRKFVLQQIDHLETGEH